MAMELGTVTTENLQPDGQIQADVITPINAGIDYFKNQWHKDIGRRLVNPIKMTKGIIDDVNALGDIMSTKKNYINETTGEHMTEDEYTQYKKQKYAEEKAEQDYQKALAEEKAEQLHEEERADSFYQRTKEDMIKAGLNPALVNWGASSSNSANVGLDRTAEQISSDKNMKKYELEYEKYLKLLMQEIELNFKGSQAEKDRLTQMIGNVINAKTRIESMKILKKD